MRKGFTLIELLAVIVILAIIAVIAVPIVLNIINDAKDSALVRSADFYIDALENEIMLENMKQGGSFNPSVCKITNGVVSCDDKEINLEVDGEVPISGTITFEDGYVTGVSLTYASGVVTKNAKGELVLGEAIQVCKLISDADNSKTVTPGDKYQCKVKDDMEEGFEDGYYFYVLSKENDGTTNLIMDRNINSDGTVATARLLESSKDSHGGIYSETAWDYTTVDNGPTTAMQFLNNATKDWNNIKNLNLTYDDENGNFTNFKITGKSRLPYLSEVKYVGCSSENLSCPVWMVDYLDDAGIDLNTTYQVNPIYEMWNYWTFSAMKDENVAGEALAVSNYGRVESVPIGGEEAVGLRPVINVQL